MIMKVEDFNTDKGLYVFKLDDLETEFHSHPAIEIIIAKQGTFTLWTEYAEHQSLKFAVLEANKKHKLSSTECELKVIMIEHHKRFVKDSLEMNGINIDKGFYFQTKQENEENIVHQIVKSINDNEFETEYDERISATINYLNNKDLEYSLMIKTLQKVTNLSESRLSHLFKSNIGISLKKYLIWTKLKSTIKKYLNNKDDLFSSSISSGFYDQPHFSKNFKDMLGVKPSKAYNSRILQVLPILTLYLC